MVELDSSNKSYHIQDKIHQDIFNWWDFLEHTAKKYC